MKIIAYTVSAFTAHGKGGNKAGVVLNAAMLSEAQMLSIAKALGYSETAFITPSNVATHKVRFFTPTEEVDLCGHATVATWALLHMQGLKPGVYSQETMAGNLGVIINGDGTVYMQQTRPHFLKKVPLKEIEIVLGINGKDFSSELEPQIVSTGLQDLLVPVRDKAVLNNMKPSFEKMVKLSKHYDVTGLHVFALNGADNPVASARNFAPRVGIDEESATGTSNGALLCYLKENGTLKGDGEFCIEQGEVMDNLSFVLGKFIDGRVWVGGEAKLLQEEAFNV